MKQRNGAVRVQQGAVNYSRPGYIGYLPFIAQVTDSYSDRMTCDVKTTDGQILRNIPMLTTAGLVDSQPYGIADLPEVDDWVIVSYAGRGIRKRVITGSFIPYLTNEYTDDATNSDSKQFTTKLLESGKEMHYKRIFKSGTTVEVEEDGTITVETPSGRYAQIDENAGALVIADLDGNKVTMNSDGMILDDANGNDITMTTGKVSINGGNLEVDQ